MAKYFIVICYRCSSSLFKRLFNLLRLKHFTEDISKCIFLKEVIWISINILLKFVPEVWINNMPALVQIMAWCWSGNKSISEPMMVGLLMHMCIPLPQWVKFKSTIHCYIAWYPFTMQILSMMQIPMLASEIEMETWLMWNLDVMNCFSLTYSTSNISQTFQEIYMLFCLFLSQFYTGKWAWLSLSSIGNWELF